MSDIYMYVPVEGDVPPPVSSILWVGGFYIITSERGWCIKQINSNNVMVAKIDDTLNIRIRNGAAIEIENLRTKRVLCAFTTKISEKGLDDVS